MEEKKSIRKLNERLYDPKSSNVLRNRTSLVKNKDLYSDYNKTSSEEVKLKSEGKKIKSTNQILVLTRNFFYGALLLFFIAVLYAGLTFYNQTNLVSADNIEIEMAVDPFIDSGESVDLLVTVNNKNTTILEDAYLVINLPNSTLDNSNVSGGGQKILLGAIFPGQQIDQVVPISVFGEQGSVWKISGMLEYKIKGSAASFQKEAEVEFTIRSTPIDIKIETLSEVISGQEAEISITLSSLSKESLKNIDLIVDYPSGFQFISGSPEPTEENRIWKISSLKTNEEFTVVLKGVFEGINKEIKNLKVTASSSLNQNDVSDNKIILNSVTKRLNIVLPFLVADIYLDNSTNQIVSYKQGGLVNGRIYWFNTFNDKLINAKVSLKIPESIDMTSIITDGVISLKERTIVWDKNTNKEIDIINPRDSGWFNFKFKLPEFVGSGKESELVFVSSTDAFDSSGVNRPTNEADKITIRQTSEIKLNSDIYYYSGPFQNKGSVPPKVENVTTYTVKVSVENTGNVVSDGLVELSLTPYAKWLGVQNASQGNVSYDQFSKKIKWEIGEMKPSIGSDFSLYFQIEVEPSFSFVGKNVPLVQGVSFRGTDTFTKTLIKKTANPLSTEVSDIPARNNGQVVN